MEYTRPTHSRIVGYLVWLLGFTGAHRFYYGKPFTGSIYFFTLGLLCIGWIMDLFFIPSMEREADIRYVPGPIDYNLAWLLLVFLGVFGIHRIYLGKFWTGILYLLTFGLCGIGYIYDMWTLNDQVTLINTQSGQSFPSSLR